MTKRKPKQWRNYLDKIFSIAVRSLGYCERCGKTKNLQTSHIFSRGIKELRWEFENAQCLCAGCHLWWHHNPVEAIEWLKDYYGNERYEALRIASRKTKQWSEEDYIQVENKIKSWKPNLNTKLIVTPF